MVSRRLTAGLPHGGSDPASLTLEEMQKKTFAPKPNLWTYINWLAPVGPYPHFQTNFTGEYFAATSLKFSRRHKDVFDDLSCDTRGKRPCCQSCFLFALGPKLASINILGLFSVSPKLRIPLESGPTFQEAGRKTRIVVHQNSRRIRVCMPFLCDVSDLLSAAGVAFWNSLLYPGLVPCFEAYNFRPHWFPATGMFPSAQTCIPKCFRSACGPTPGEILEPLSYFESTAQVAAESCPAPCQIRQQRGSYH